MFSFETDPNGSDFEKEHDFFSLERSERAEGCTAGCGDGCRAPHSGRSPAWRPRFKRYMRDFSCECLTTNISIYLMDASLWCLLLQKIWENPAVTLACLPLKTARWEKWRIAILVSKSKGNDMLKTKKRLPYSCFSYSPEETSHHPEAS